MFAKKSVKHNTEDPKFEQVLDLTLYIDAVLRPPTFPLRLRVKNMEGAVDSLPVIVKVERFP